MILPSSKIRFFIESFGAVRPAPPERLDNIESDVYDLTIDAIFQVKGKSQPLIYEAGVRPEVFFGIEKRRVPPQRELSWSPNEDGNFQTTCEPGVPYVFRTVEEFCVPPGLKVEVINRSSVNRSGGTVHGTMIPHGYTGKIFVVFEIPVYGHPFTWERGARFCSTLWHRMETGHYTPYDGVWSGEKSCTDGTERAF